MVALNELVGSHASAPSAEPTGRPPRVGLTARLRSYLPQGNLLDDRAWTKRHRLLQWLLLFHIPGILLYGLGRGYPITTALYVCAPIAGCLALGTLVQRRRIASFFVTAGLVYCSSALVGLSGGIIEAHFHFFIIIGFIALYQDWVPFLWNILFTVFGHGLGSAWSGTLIFNHPSAQQNPWLWSLIHGVAVLAACVGMVIFWRYSEDEMQQSITLRTQMAESEIERRRFTSDLLVNLARRNQSMLHLQLGIINQLEDAERDPDALADLFRLDHLATRIRRNAESLLVLSGEEPPRVWSQPVQLRDVVRAAIAETEDLDRVDYEIEDDLSVHGRLVTGLTHLLAELVENAVHFSPPQTRVTVRARPDHRVPGTQVITVEDLGLGMPSADLAAANQILAEPPDVDLSTSQRYGLHVVSRLARRLDLRVHLTPTANSGITAVVLLPGTLFVAADPRPDHGRSLAPRPSGQPAPSQPALPLPSAQLPSAQLPSAQLPSAQLLSAQVPAFVPAGHQTPFYAGPAPSEPAHHVTAPAGPASVAGRPLDQRPAVDFGVDVRDDGWAGWWGDAAEPYPVADPYLGQVGAERVVDLRDPRETSDPPLARRLAERLIEQSALAQRSQQPLATPSLPVADDPAELSLSHRTPQAHLAPELRRRSVEPTRPAVEADAVTARDALSAYQARRQAALDVAGQNAGGQNAGGQNAGGRDPGGPNAGGQNRGGPDGRTGWPEQSR